VEDLEKIIKMRLSGIYRDKRRFFCFIGNYSELVNEATGWGFADEDHFPDLNPSSDHGWKQVAVPLTWPACCLRVAFSRPTTRIHVDRLTVLANLKNEII
jgi:hypothetical protein